VGPARVHFDRDCPRARATTFTAFAGAARTTGWRAASRRRLWTR